MLKLISVKTANSGVVMSRGSRILIDQEVHLEMTTQLYYYFWTKNTISGVGFMCRALIDKQVQLGMLTQLYYFFWTKNPISGDGHVSDTNWQGNAIRNAISVLLFFWAKATKLRGGHVSGISATN